MAIREHPKMGSLLMCNFEPSFRAPEMVKRRLVVVISPRIEARPGLCTVVALSLTPPNPVMPYHCQIDIWPQLPPGFASTGVWVKGDMINAVGFHRLDLVRSGKDGSGKRSYHYATLSDENMRRIKGCILHALGLASLTRHLA